MPAIAPASIALASAVPGAALPALVIAQAVGSVTLSSDWRPGGLPFRAALRIEPEQSYLRRRLPDFDIVRMIDANTRRDDNILVFTNLPDAYTDRTLLVYWHSRQGLQFADALKFGALSRESPAMLMSWNWRARRMEGTRVMMSWYPSP